MIETIIGIVLREASSIAAPFVRKVLSENFGAGGDAAGQLLERIAGYAGVATEDIPRLPQETLQQAIAAAEPDATTIWLEAQRLTNETVALDYSKGPWWAWAWRPAWMWLLAIFWIYAIIIQPITAAWAYVEPVDVGILMTLTGVFVAFYMGGHTAKSLLNKKG